LRRVPSVGEEDDDAEEEDSDRFRTMLLRFALRPLFFFSFAFRLDARRYTGFARLFSPLSLLPLFSWNNSFFFCAVFSVSATSTNTPTNDRGYSN
jgi:hypothetical protein